ncbi:hypothetical protein CDAR_17501 [Caerostris darwini]|uniref:Uncharacterized protein n=1 Tax=Caerostris darwini TaxID=1538125 RepID=A0AAV4VDG6_9ARAC|nr:hypothetical protein CDAR_17501 [Caerostris darwini]
MGGWAGTVECTAWLGFGLRNCVIIDVVPKAYVSMVDICGLYDDIRSQLIEGDEWVVVLLEPERNGRVGVHQVSRGEVPGGPSPHQRDHLLPQRSLERAPTNGAQRA